MVSVDLLEEPGLLLERLDPSHFWHGINASLADKWSTRSRPSLFLPPGGRLHLVELALLPLLRRVRLGERCGENRSAKRLRLCRLREWSPSSRPIGSCPETPKN